MGKNLLFPDICLNISFAVIKLFFQSPWKSNKLTAVTAYTFSLVIGKMILTTSAEHTVLEALQSLEKPSHSYHNMQSAHTNEERVKSNLKQS